MAGRVLVVLQSRLSSSRLPAKALLPLAGTTTVALAARRAANTGLDVVVATSVDASDDALAAHLAQQGLPVVRGPLDDVLGRFVLAAEGLADDDVVVRLTADCLLPDGAFIAELVRDRAARGATYLATRSPLDGLPYGLSAEAFTAGALRAAAAQATSAFDREHVTPWIERTYGTPIFRPGFAGASLAHLRCTLDTFADYLRLQRLFAGVAEPSKASAAELVQRLSELPGEPRFRVPFRAIGDEVHGALVLDVHPLASAGVAAIRAAVAAAIAHGVTCVEERAATAASSVGASWPVGFANQASVSLPFDLDDHPAESGRDVALGLRAVVMRALHDLRVPSVASLSVRLPPRADDRAVVWELMRGWRREGIVERLGVVASDVADARAALDDVDVGQLRVVLGADAGVLRAWNDPAFIGRVRERQEVLVHVSSKRLDAALAADVNGAASRSAVGELAELDWVTGIVAGVSQPDQLPGLLTLFRNAFHGDQR